MQPKSMGLAIAMFSLCAGRARELSSRYVYGNGRNVAWETRNGISRTWSVGEDKLKTFRRQKHHPLTVLNVREHRPGAPGAGCHKADAGKTSRPVYAGDLTVSQMRRLQTYTEKYDGAGRLSGLPLLQTHYGVKVEAKLKLDHNEVPRAFVQKFRRSVLPKSLRTHPDHTPLVDLTSLFVHSHK